MNILENPLVQKYFGSCEHGEYREKPCLCQLTYAGRVLTSMQEPAFPVDKEHPRVLQPNGQYAPSWIEFCSGLTKREWFAGQALRGAIEWRDKHTRPEKFDVEALARDCWTIADAMLAHDSPKGGEGMSD